MSKSPVKLLEWVASSKKDLLSMPSEVVDIFGYALHLAQHGGKHQQAKPLKGSGSAGVLEVVEDDDGSTYRAVYTVVLEVVEDDDGSTYRAVYTVKFGNAIYVLHCFQKKSHKGIETAKQDIDLIRDRLKFAQKHSEGVTK